MVCSDFRKAIPEKFAIESAFAGVLIRKVEIFRLFPLSVYDVVSMRSPLLFVDAFRMALGKTGGFDFCIAVMREKGWTLWNSIGVKREAMRSKLNSELIAGGISWPVTGRLFQAAVSGKKKVLSAAVWRLDCLAEELPHWQAFQPSPGAPQRIAYARWEYEEVMFRLHGAVGFWYKGINHDVRCIIKEIRCRRASGRTADCMHHQHVAAKKFIFGVIIFRPFHGLEN